MGIHPVAIWSSSRRASHMKALSQAVATAVRTTKSGCSLSWSYGHQFANLEMAIQFIDLPIIFFCDVPSLCERLPEGTLVIIHF